MQIPPHFHQAGTPYRNDKPWGIAIVALAALGICAGLFSTVLGAAVGLIGGAAATTAGPEGQSAALAAGGVGGIFALIGIGILVCSIVQIAGGIGVMQGRRWGFILTGILAIISLLLNLPSFPAGLFGIAASAAMLYYCYQRLYGNEGPTPG